MWHVALLLEREYERQPFFGMHAMDVTCACVHHSACSHSSPASRLGVDSISQQLQLHNVAHVRHMHRADQHNHPIWSNTTPSAMHRTAS